MAGKRLMNLFQLKRNSMANRLDLLMNSSAALVLVIFLLLAGPLEAWQEATALAMIGLAATRPVVALLRHYATWPMTGLTGWPRLPSRTRKASC